MYTAAKAHTMRSVQHARRLKQGCLNFLFGAIISFFSLTSQSSTDTIIHFAIHDGTYHEYGFDKMRSPCKELELKTDAEDHRMAIEFKLICMVFEAANIEAHMKFTTVPNYARGLRFVESGKVDTTAETVWLSNLSGQPEAFIATEDVIPYAEFQKGIYTRLDHPLQQLRSVGIDDLRRYTSAIPHSWTHDRDILQLLSAKVVVTSNYDSLTSMLYVGRADFSLLEFPKHASLDKYWRGTYLVPLQNVKVAIPDSRVFVFSAKSKHSAAMKDAFDLGLKRLKENGKLKAFMIEQGLINPHVESWRTLSIEAHMQTTVE